MDDSISGKGDINVKFYLFFSIVLVALSKFWQLKNIWSKSSIVLMLYRYLCQELQFCSDVSGSKYGQTSFYK